MSRITSKKFESPIKNRYYSNGGLERSLKHSNGGFYIGGWLTSLASTTVNSLIKTNLQKYTVTIDSTFTSNFGILYNNYWGSRGQILSLTELNDGSIVFVGHFDTLTQGSTVTNVNRILSVNADGTLSSIVPNFGTGFDADDETYTVSRFSDSSFVVGGYLNTFNGSTLPSHVCKFSSNGIIIPSFSSNALTSGVNDYVSRTVIQPDDKLILLGGFSGKVTRLNSNGTLDTAFKTNIGTGFPSAAQVDNMELLSNGKIVIVGSFTSFNGTTVKNIVMLNSDGTLDTTFLSNIGSGFNSQVYTVSSDSSNNLYLAGSFTSYKSTSVPCAVVINYSGSIVNNFSSLSEFVDGGSSDINAVYAKDDDLIVWMGYNSDNSLAIMLTSKSDLLSWTCPAGVTEILISSDLIDTNLFFRPMSISVTPNTTYIITSINLPTPNTGVFNQRNSFGSIFSWAGDISIKITWVE